MQQNSSNLQIPKPQGQNSKQKQPYTTSSAKPKLSAKEFNPESLQQQNTQVQNPSTFHGSNFKNFGNNQPQLSATSSQADSATNQGGFSMNLNQNKLKLKKKVKKPAAETQQQTQQVPQQQQQGQGSVLNSLNPDSIKQEQQKLEEQKKKQQEEEERKKLEDKKKAEEEQKRQEEEKLKNKRASQEDIKKFFEQYTKEFQENKDSDKIAQIKQTIVTIPFEYQLPQARLKGMSEQQLKEEQQNDIKEKLKYFERKQEFQQLYARNQNFSGKGSNFNKSQNYGNNTTGNAVRKGANYKQRQNNYNTQQNEEGGFSRKEESEEVKKIKQNIENATGKWNSEQQTKDPKTKDIIFTLQTIAPDNVDIKVEKMLQYACDDEYSEFLVKTSIEKGSKDIKYTKTFAEFLKKMKEQMKRIDNENKNSGKKETKYEKKFRSQLSSSAQNEFEKQITVPEKYQELNPEQLEAYYNKLRDQKKKLLNFLGECIIKKVFPIKIRSIFMTQTLGKFLDFYQKAQYLKSGHQDLVSQALQEKQSNEPEQSRKIKIQYGNVILFEIFIQFIETTGGFFESHDKKGAQDPESEKQAKELYNNIQKLLKNPTQVSLYNFSTSDNQGFGDLTIDQICDILQQIHDQELFEIRITSLISNLLDKKNQGWAVSLKDKGNQAVSLRQVREEWEQQNTSSNVVQPQYVQQQQYQPQQQQRYQPKETQQSQQQQQNIDATLDDVTDYPKSFSKKTLIDDLLAQARKEGEQVLTNNGELTRLTNYLFLPNFFMRVSYCKTDDELQQNITLAKAFLTKYFSFQNNKQNIGLVCKLLFTTGYSNKTDFNNLDTVYIELLSHMRNSVKVLSLDQIVIVSEEDEEEDEYLIEYFRTIMIGVGKKTLSVEPDLNQFKSEIQKVQYENILVDTKKTGDDIIQGIKQ